MSNATDYRVENIQKANLNGKMVKLFKAYRDAGSHFEFVGEFSAPARTADKSLWKIAAEYLAS